MSAQPRTRTAWGIDLGALDIDRAATRPASHLAGYLMFDWARPDHLTGYVTAAFSSRAMARDALIRRDLRRTYPRAKVVRLVISVAPPNAARLSIPPPAQSAAEPRP